MVSSPKAPDPVATANAQAGLNNDTAISQQFVNMVDQVNPYGTVNYDQTGMTGYVNSQGKYIQIPKFTQTTTFSPEQQGIFDRTQAAQSNLAGLAEDQSGALRDYLNTSFDFENQDAADWSYDLASSRILPQQQQATEALRTQLVNSGLRPGTEAYDREMTRIQQGQGDQLNQLALTGRSQAFAEALARRNQPINEITALLSGSQVSNPAAMSAPSPQASVGGVDYTGLVSNNYQSQLANSGGMMGGLFGLAGTLGSAGIKAGLFSDVRLKTDISRVGTLDNGLPVYAYRYKAGGPMQIGLMAHEVAAVHPEAVMAHPSGFAMVDYGRAVH